MDFLRVMVWTNLIVYLTIVIYMIIDIRRNSSKLENSQCKISVDQENKKTTNYPDKGGNEIQKPGNPETKKITGANNSNDNKKSIEPAQIDKIPIDSSEKNSSSNMNKDGEKSTIEFDQSNPEKGQTRSRLLEDAANAATERIKAEKLLSTAEMYATKAQTKIQTALERIKSAISLLNEGKLNLVENEARTAVGPATDAITAAQAFSRENMLINPVVIGEFPNDFSTDSDLVSIIATARGNARIVNDAIEKLNSKKEIVNDSQSAAEKVIAKIPLLIAAANVALEHAKANAVLSEATKVQENSEAASAAIDLAKFLLKEGKLYLVEKEVQNADRSATNAITAAETFNTDKNSITPIHIDELPTELSKDSDLKSIMSAARENATKVKNAIITLMSKEAIIKSKQSAAKKAKAAVPFLRAASKAAHERQKADKLLPNIKMLASKVEQKSRAATSAIDSAKIALQTDRLDDVETEALKAERSSIQAIEAAQNFSYDKNVISSVVIDKLPDELSSDSDMKSIKSIADENAAKVREAIRTMNTEEATVISSQSSAEKAKKAIPLLHVALQAARERKKADKLLPNVEMLASEVERKSLAASSAIHSAKIALQTDRLDDVETEALKAESSAIEAIKAAQNFSYDKNSISSVDIDDFSANASEGSGLASIKSKVENDAAEVKKAIETINLKRASVISSQSAAEKAKAAVPLLRSAAKVAIERKKADAVLSIANKAEEQSQAASKIIESAMDLLEHGNLDLVENKALDAETPATVAIAAAQNFRRDKNSINSIDIAELPAVLSTDSDLESIKSKADDDAVEVNAAIGMIRTKEASVISSQSAAEKAKAAVPFLRIALAVAGERKNADTFLPEVETYASEAELKSQAASRAIESAISALQNDQLTDVETQANNAEHSATEAITAAQKLITNSNTVTPINIDEFSANVTEGSVLASIKTKVEDDAAKVKKANKTINLKRESVILHKATAEKAKAAVPFLRIALAVAGERKNATERVPRAQNSAAESAKNAKKAADILSDVKSADPSLSDSISLQADVALSLASQAIANARTFSSTKRLVDYAATKARQSATQISDEFADIKAIANKFAMEAEEASNTLAKLVDSVKTSKSSAGSTQTEASTLVEM